MNTRVKRRLMRGEPLPLRTEFSRKLRRVTELLGHAQREEALQLLAVATRDAHSDIHRSQIANLVAKSQFLLGRYPDAAERFKEAARLGARDGLDPQKFLGPSLGHIRCLLKNQQVDEAEQAARVLGDQVLQKHRTYEQHLAAAAGVQAESVTVPPRPVRPAVAFTRIGLTFLNEGYPEMGKAFLEEVVAAVPKGASRARQALARAMMQEGNLERATRLAKESIQFGHFQAKTLPSWTLLLQARQISGFPALDIELYQEFQKSSLAPGVRARTEGIVISELRRLGDDAWIQLSNPWRTKRTGQDPVVRVEVLKLLLSELKAGGIETETPAQDILEIAWELYLEPTLAGSECMMLAKVMGTYGLRAGMSIETIKVRLKDMHNRFGSNYGLRAVHSCAMGMVEAAEYEGARPLFLWVIETATLKSPEWGKAVWSLARTESSDGNHSRAAHLYLRFAANSSIEPSRRLQAFLRWVREMEASGEEINEDQVLNRVRILLAGISDYRPLLDAGRQLALAGPRFRTLLSEVVDAAEKRSLQAFKEAKTTREALVVVVALNRRLFYDFARAQRVIDLFEALPDRKLQWLWSPDSRFWEYLSIVVRAYFLRGEVAKGEAMARKALEDAATPVVGKVYLGVHYGEWLLQRGRRIEAMALFSRCVEESPRHRLISRAYYWLALDAYAGDSNAISVELLRLARRCLLPRPSLLSEWETDSRCGLLLRDLGLEGEEIDLRLYEADFLTRQSSHLYNDLKRFGKN